jgi:translation elongation factor P/translation initiation factor 5A
LAEDSVKTATTPRQKQAYMRIMGYIAQVMNSLSKTFDEAMVTKDLEALEKMISEAMAKGKDKGTQRAAQGSSGS